MGRRKNAALLAVATSFIVAGLGAGGVASASAADATLTIQRLQDENGITYNEVTVNGTASRWFPGGRVAVRLWGDDEWYDDLIDGPSWAWFDGQTFTLTFWPLDCELDEDWDGTDEIYAGVRVYDGANRERETAETNRVEASW